MEDNMRAQTTFDRFHGIIEGLPGVTSTKPSAVKQSLPLIGGVTVTTVQTFKGQEFGFTIALTVVDADGKAYNHILPNKVAAAIYRQRQSLTDRSTPASRLRERRKRERAKKRAEREARRKRYQEPLTA